MIFEKALSMGVPAGGLLKKCGINESVLYEADGRLEQKAAYSLWDALGEASGDEAFGLHLAEQLDAGAFAVLDYVVRHASTLGDACREFERFCRLVHSGAEVRFTLRGDEGSLSYHVASYPEGLPRHTAEFVIAVWVIIGRQILEMDFSPVVVRFQHGKPSSIAEHRRLFRCPVEFRAQYNDFTMSRILLDHPVAKADPKLKQVLDRYAAELLGRVPAGEAFEVKVRRCITEALKRGHSSLEVVAKLMNMSPRTLQRRFASGGTSHQAVLDEVRCALARKYLKDPSISIGETAFLLGFSEASAFHRAFKRWTNETPSSYRKHALSGISKPPENSC